MFERLLVPLDGSVLAESVLPVAVTLAERLPARITLLHVVESDPPESVHGARHLTRADEAEAYLAGVAERLRREAGVEVSHHVHTVAEGRVAQSIVEHSRELGQDLVVIATHGRGGVRGFLWGNVAQQVLGEGERPVLVVHAPAGQGEEDDAVQVLQPQRWQTVVVPLDGGERHETSLPVAAEVARRFGARLHLVTVIPQRADLRGSEGTLGRFFPAATQAMLEAEEQQAAAYLAVQAHHWAELAGIAVTTEVRWGEPAAQLVEALKQQNADLVVMASHAHRGWEAFWAGRVTPRVMAQWGRPALLVQAGPMPDRPI
ncbi:MAG: universal stress protein [Limnochordaceae bacterium]|nr:universal stress protein [Limnochordaceae bacterium]